MLAAWLDFSYSSSWLPSSDKPLADTTSHSQYNHLFTLAPSMKKKPCPMLPQLRGIKHTLTCPPGLHSSSGMVLHPRPTRLIEQDRNHSMTSSLSIPNTGTQMGQLSQHLKQPCSNGLHGLVVPKGSSQKQSRHMLHTYHQATSMQGYHSQHVSPPCSSILYEELKGTWENANTSQSYPLHVTYSHICWLPQPNNLCSGGSILKQQ